MPINTLTAQAGLRLGPVVLETLVKHYFERLRTREGKGYTHLREEEMLYDQAFGIARAFMRAASHSTVEEVQAFANTWTPSPPWVHVIRLTIPMSCCNDAAAILIQAFGGEETTRRILGGIKWWQVRGLNGVDAQWITTRRDWKEAKRRYKRQAEASATDDIGSGDSGASPEYAEEMDGMRCILYLHGGGYYFGSVDQERYSIQRHARKINGRVFAVNYRLAPQYPFPCALHDLIAAYLYLIRPPPGAKHKAVKPSNIVIVGDSAGGGMSLALLQVIRDTGLPPPAGGVLISPWCDLTHSFPSIHKNTETDVIPPWGLCLQKPSPLWPPPSEELATHVRTRLRSRVKHALHLSERDHSLAAVASNIPALEKPSDDLPVNIGSSTAPPSVDPSSQIQKIVLETKAGDTLVVDTQVQLYTQNSMLDHPLISCALSYLGGLPPLLFIAGDKEVLRDEIIYAAHKAARPDEYPIKESARQVYPPLQDIERRCKPTKVHLQVYDDAAHVLPVLFSFTTPAKYCYRGIASFIKHVTGPQSTYSLMQELPKSSVVAGASSGKSNNHPDFLSSDPGSSSQCAQPSRPSLRRSLSTNFKRATTTIRRARSDKSLGKSNIGIDTSTTSMSGASKSSDVAGPRFTYHRSSSPLPRIPSLEDSGNLTPRLAGDTSVYKEGYDNNMIRERVSTHGEIRPLEPEKELDAFSVPPELVGTISELAIRRYLDGKAKFDKKYVHSSKVVEKQRRRNIERAKKDVYKTFFGLQAAQKQDQQQQQDQDNTQGGSDLLADSWDWAWLVEGNEHPPPSSIAARRDTDEARCLALIADQAVMPEPKILSANNLWSVIVNFLTVTPDSHPHERNKETKGNKEPHRPSKRLSQLFSSKRKATIVPAAETEQNSIPNPPAS